MLHYGWIRIGQNYALCGAFIFPPCVGLGYLVMAVLKT